MASSSQSWKAIASSRANPIDIERSPSAPSLTDSGYKSGQPSSPSDELVRNDNDRVHDNEDTISVFSEDTILEDWQDPKWQETNLKERQPTPDAFLPSGWTYQIHEELPNYFSEAFVSATTEREFDIEDFLNFSKCGNDSLNFPEIQAKDCTSLSNVSGFSVKPSFHTTTNFETFLGKGDNLFFTSEPVISAPQPSLEEFFGGDADQAAAAFAAREIDFDNNLLQAETICPSTIFKPPFSRFQRVVNKKRSIPKKGLFLDRGETCIVARQYQVLRARLFPMKVKKCRRCKKAKKHPGHKDCKKHRQSIMYQKDMLVTVNERGQKECQTCWAEADCPLHLLGGDLDFEKRESIYDVFLGRENLDGRFKDNAIGKENLETVMGGTLMES